MELKNLAEFIVKANRATYASGDSSLAKKETDSSTTLTFAEGDWSYHDNYFGGEPFGGREVVHYQGKPVFIMTYYGFVFESVTDPKPIYETLQAALRLLPLEAPYRGPKSFINGEYEYKNSYVGEIARFSGKEEIYYNGTLVYEASYMGGVVDR